MQVHFFRKHLLELQEPQQEGAQLQQCCSNRPKTQGQEFYPLDVWL